MAEEIAVENVPEAGLALVADMIASVTRGDSLERTLGLICRSLCNIAGFRFCGVLVPDAAWMKFRLAGGHGFPPHYVERLNDLFLVTEGESQSASPTRQAAERRTTIVNADVLEVPSFVPWRSFALEFEYRSMVSIPLFADGEVIGVLNGYSAHRRDFSIKQLSAVETLAAHAAVTLRIAMLMDERRETIRRLQVSNEELERQRLVLERAHEIHQRLTAAALAGTDAHAIAQALSELIHRPVAVTEADGRVRATSNPGADPDALNALIDAVGAVAPLLERGDIPRDGRSRLVIAGIRIPHERLGYVLLPEGDAAPADLDQRAAEHAATVLALEAVKERVVLATEDRLRADFLAELFRDRLDDDPPTLERASRHGLRIGGVNRVIVVEVQHDVQAGREKTRSGSAEKARSLIRRDLQRIPLALVHGTSEVLTVIIPSGDGRDPAVDVRARLERLQARLREEHLGSTLSAGIGTIATGLRELAASHRDAELCLDLGRRLGRPGSIIARDELGILGLFVDAKHPEQLRAVAQGVLGPALEYDTRKAGSLVETLSAYLEAGCDIQSCATGLFIHSNTVKYRLRKVEELCGVTLRNPDDLLRVRVATLTLALL